MDSRVNNQLNRRGWIFISIIAVFLAGDTYCQSIARWVVSPLGSQYDNNFQLVQATLGEPVVLTVTDTMTFFLTQGFQQPSPSELPFEDYKITIIIYPNPVKTMITVEFYVKDVDDFTIDIRDMLGKMISRKRVYDIYSGQAEFFDFSSFSQGVYFVHVYSDNEEMEIVEKIIKL
ncbi:MAG: T9SS type A sorting domain-containing protein [Bacteroidales bacterium]|nr:T9SS type A sorting domain-containing protein [Bacteroidales bacterium]